LKPFHLGGQLDLLDGFVCQTVEIPSHESKEAIALSGIDDTNQFGIVGRLCPSKLAIVRKATESAG